MIVIYTTGLGVSESGKKPESMAKNVNLPYRIFEYQDILENTSDALLKKHSTYGGPIMRKGKKLLYDYATDATLYEKHKEAVLNKLKALIDTLPVNEEIALVGHSLGCVVFYDYLYQRPQNLRITKFITTGNPLPMFKGNDYFSLIKVDWTNYWEDSDPIAHKMFLLTCKDVEHKSRHFWKGWNWLAHIAYLKSKKLAKKVRKNILE